ncbi:hypothetical protein M0805_002262 [Coniferiporia weirii]|nr:hypothetical protein M0805_002262 [Coniferiporia weirii]
MKLTTLVTPFVLLAISVAQATSLVDGKYGSPDADQTHTLQLALSLEHLDSTFYATLLSKFDKAAFKAAGYPDWVRGRFVQITQHEFEHVKYLTDALGSNAPAACKYNFTTLLTDVPTALGGAMMFETIGTSAYVGGSKFLKDKKAITASAAILTAEGQHQSWLSSSVQKNQPWSSAFWTPLGANQTYTLASAYIVACPPSNPKLPFKAFPALMVNMSPLTQEPGNKVQLHFDNKGSQGKQLFLTILSGINKTVMPIDKDNKVTLPKGLQGAVYVIVGSDSKGATDESTVAGPALLQFPFPSWVSNP